VQQRIRVQIEYLDGTTEDLDSEGQLQLGLPGMFLVPQPRGGHVGVNVLAVKRWEAIPSGLTVIRGAN
jgi:hypothetical protein